MGIRSWPQVSSGSEAGRPGKFSVDGCVSGERGSEAELREKLEGALDEPEQPRSAQTAAATRPPSQHFAPLLPLQVCLDIVSLHMSAGPVLYRMGTGFY